MTRRRAVAPLQPHHVTPRNFVSNNVLTRVISLHVALILNKGLMLTNLESM
ncbi:hypothetical protein Hanom_Chr09g00836361 [Helianthus anomalus]